MVVMKMHIARTCSMMLGKATDIAGQARQTNVMVFFFSFSNILNKTSCEFVIIIRRNCTSGLFFFTGLGNSFFLDFLGHRAFPSTLCRSFSFFWFYLGTTLISAASCQFDLWAAQELCLTSVCLRLGQA